MTNSEKPLYTLDEAREELKRQECRYFGHDFNNIMNLFTEELIKVVCDRCGKTWEVKGA